MQGVRAHQSSTTEEGFHIRVWCHYLVLRCYFLSFAQKQQLLKGSPSSSLKPSTHPTPYSLQALSQMLFWSDSSPSEAHCVASYFCSLSGQSSALSIAWNVCYDLISAYHSFFFPFSFTTPASTVTMLLSLFIVIKFSGLFFWKLFSFSILAYSFLISSQSTLVATPLYEAFSLCISLVILTTVLWGRCLITNKWSLLTDSFAYMMIGLELPRQVPYHWGHTPSRKKFRFSGFHPGIWSQKHWG
jgi:hypothetical protein